MTPATTPSTRAPRNEADQPLADFAAYNPMSRVSIGRLNLRNEGDQPKRITAKASVGRPVPCGRVTGSVTIAVVSGSTQPILVHPPSKPDAGPGFALLVDEQRVASAFCPGASLTSAGVMTDVTPEPHEIAEGNLTAVLDLVVSPGATVVAEWLVNLD